eukprot:1023507-Prymnesium_polylepis.1
MHRILTFLFASPHRTISPPPYWQRSLSSWGMPVLSIRGPGYPPRWSMARSVTPATSATSPMSAMSIYRR